MTKKFNTKHPLYYIWYGIIERCENPLCPNYSNYGERGVKICKEWRNSFNQFTEDMGPRPEKHSIDRIDVNGNYCKENCRWADTKTQNRNKRNNVFLEHKGERKVISDWAEAIGLDPKSLKKRLERGWTIEEAITTPRQAEEVLYENKEGEWLNQKDFAKYHNIGLSTFRRAEAGWSIEEAVKPAQDPIVISSKKRRSLLNNCKRKTQHLAAWCKETGLDHKTITNRLDVLGWTEEESLLPVGQVRRKQKENLRMITFEGITKPLVEWAEELGISRRTLSIRLDRLGWSLEKALGKL